MPFVERARQAHLFGFGIMILEVDASWNVERGRWWRRLFGVFWFHALVIVLPVLSNAAQVLSRIWSSRRASCVLHRQEWSVNGKTRLSPEAALSHIRSVFHAWVNHGLAMNPIRKGKSLCYPNTK